MSNSAGTVGMLLRGLGARLGRLDARLLVEAVCGLTHAELIARPETPLSADQADRLEALATRRERGEPLAYLLGQAEFRGLVLAVSPAVLVPRPETEVLVEWALEAGAGWQENSQKNKGNATFPFRLLDLGTGSGAIPLALKHARPDWQITALDVSPAALAVARSNAERLGLAVDFIESDWTTKLAADFTVDCIVSNPPYVAAGDPHLSGDGLRYEPAMALTDFADGLSALRQIVASAPAHLEADGWLLLEHGYDQAAAVRAMLEKDFSAIETRRDLAGIERVSGGRLKANALQPLLKQENSKMSDVQAIIKEQVSGNPVVLYMKGSPQMPQCGFSARAVQILKACGVNNFYTVDVLQNADIREGVKTYANWPTLPQLYVKGEFVGGCDIMTEMYQSGELQPLLAELKN